MRRLLVTTGMKREARILAAPDCEIVVSGGDVRRLKERMERALMEPVRGIMSMGLAGALDPALPVGALVIASAISAQGKRFAVDPVWLERLRALLPQAKIVEVYGADAIVVDAAAKARLRAASGAAAVDMESHIAAAKAERLALPFAAVRVISDAADHALPPAAQVGLKGDGGMDAAAVLQSLFEDRGQLRALIRTARQAEQAFRALRATRAMLGDSLASPGKS